jgi:hypothetical protein
MTEAAAVIELDRDGLPDEGLQRRRAASKPSAGVMRRADSVRTLGSGMGGREGEPEEGEEGGGRSSVMTLSVEEVERAAAGVAGGQRDAGEAGVKHLAGLERLGDEHHAWPTSSK